MSTITKPATILNIEIQGQQFKVNYPNTGQMIDIATLKSKLSDGQYAQLFFQRSNESIIALQLIDSYCFFSVMLPELKNSLQVKSLYDLQVFESAEVIHIYNNVVSPWLDDWTETINGRMAELKGDDKSDSKRALV